MRAMPTVASRTTREAEIKRGTTGASRNQTPTKSVSHLRAGRRRAATAETIKTAPSGSSPSCVPFVKSPVVTSTAPRIAIHERHSVPTIVQVALLRAGASIADSPGDSDGSAVGAGGGHSEPAVK